MTLRDNPSGPRTPAWVLVGAPPPHQREPLRPLDPDRWRKRGRWVVIAVGILVVTVVALSIVVRAVHPRDEADFVIAVRQADGSPLSRAAVVGSDDPVDLDRQARPVSLDALGRAPLIREGDFACGWLDQQDRPFWNHGFTWTRTALLDRYLRETRPQQPALWGLPSTWPDSRAVVADAAWSQLCGGTWFWHRPHGPDLRRPNWGGGGAESD